MFPGLASSIPSALLLPLLIFMAEMSVVTISTLRIIFVAQGRRYLAPLLGAVEILLWLYAIGQIMQHLSDLSCYLAFAGGFTTGNFLGILIEQKLALGNVVVRIVTKNANPLIEDLRAAEYGVTSLDGRGATGPVQVVFSVIKRKELANVRAIIQRFDRNAFYSVDDLQSAAQGVPDTRTSSSVWPRSWSTTMSRLQLRPTASKGKAAFSPEG